MVDHRDLRQIFSSFATGVTVMTAYGKDGSPVGITANSFTSVSLEPPMVLWCLDNRSRHLQAFCKGAPFAVHILSEEQEDMAMQFARSGASALERDGAAHCGPAPKIEEVLARIECRVADLHIAGDHTIIIGEIVKAEMVETPPLVFQRSRFGRFVPANQLSGQEAWHLLVDMWA